MSIQRNKILAVCALVLAAFSAMLFLMRSGEDRPVVDRLLFAVEATEKIDHVQLIRNKDTVELTFTDGRWKVNERYDADVQMIKVLMATLLQEVPHRPVAKVLTDSVNRRLDRTGTHVLISSGGATQLEFVAGGNEAKSEAWFRKSGDLQPYLMIIPGYRVYVAGIFELRESGWRNKRIFDFNWRNFKTLTASYPREPKEDFVVEMKRDYFGIRGMDPLDTTKLNDYLDAVSLLMARRFVDASERGADSVARMAPLARIEIRDIADRTYGLELFAAGSRNREVYGRLSDGQLVAFDRDDVPAVTRRRAFFRPGQGR